MLYSKLSSSALLGALFLSLTKLPWRKQVEILIRMSGTLVFFFSAPLLAAITDSSVLLGSLFYVASSEEGSGGL